MTSSCCSCQHAAVHATMRLFMPPCGPHLTLLATGSLERSLLVFSTPGGLTAMTFRACSSPAPTPVKPKPAPAILSQESVHTTLSITHHTRKRPPTGPRTTHGPQSPTWFDLICFVVWPNDPRVLVIPCVYLAHWHFFPPYASAHPSNAYSTDTSGTRLIINIC
jgi:hypothetical protein